MNCHYCKTECKKAGYQSNGKQKYKCIQCKRYQQRSYRYKGCEASVEEQIVRHVKRGSGIRDIAYLLEISPVTVIRKIRKIGSVLTSRFSGKKGCVYEVDEMKSYEGWKENECWILYGIERSSREAVDIVVGKRTKVNAAKVISTILDLQPKKIYTDGWIVYPSLIDTNLHRAGRYITNRIERKNLNLRTWLKRLGRKTLCYTKQRDMLESCVKICLWS